MGTGTGTVVGTTVVVVGATGVAVVVVVATGAATGASAVDAREKAGLTEPGVVREAARASVPREIPHTMAMPTVTETTSAAAVRTRDRDEPMPWATLPSPISSTIC
jgi:hypothetical protein